MAGAFFAAVFFAVLFFAAVFLAGAFLAGAFFAGPFPVAVFFAVGSCVDESSVLTSAGAASESASTAASVDAGSAFRWVGLRDRLLFGSAGAVSSGAGWAACPAFPCSASGRFGPDLRERLLLGSAGAVAPSAGAASVSAWAAAMAASAMSGNEQSMLRRSAAKLTTTSVVLSPRLSTLRALRGGGSAMSRRGT